MIKRVNNQPSDQIFFCGGGGGGGGAIAKGEKKEYFTISLNSSHLLPPQYFNLSTCYGASSYWKFSQLVERRDNVIFNFSLRSFVTKFSQIRKLQNAR